MSIRLNKALRELNIGLQTAVEFLEKKSELGEVKPEPSFKLNDEQYNALVAAFQQDKEVRNQAEKLQQKKPKEKKRSLDAKEHRAETLLTQPSQQQYKPLGKIDLDNLGKKPADKPTVKPKPEQKPQAVTAAVSQKEEKKEESKTVAKTAATTQEHAQQPAAKTARTDNADNASAAKQQNEKPVVQNKEAKTEQGKATQNAVGTPATKVTETPAQAESAEETEQKKAEATLFTTKSEKKILNVPKVNVLGKIDLSALNQSTRPKKKSKEEKRRSVKRSRNSRAVRRKSASASTRCAWI